MSFGGIVVRVNGFKLRTGRVLGALIVLLNLCFLGGFLSAKLLAPPTYVSLFPNSPVFSRAEMEQRGEALKNGAEYSDSVALLDSEEENKFVWNHSLIFKTNPSRVQQIVVEDLKDDYFFAQIRAVDANQEKARSQSIHSTLSLAIEKNPSDCKKLIERGELYLKLKLYARAWRDFDRAIDLADDSSEAYLGRGRANLFLGNFEEAETDLTEAVDLDEDSARPYQERARLFWEMGKLSEARSDLEDALERDQDNGGLLHELAKVSEEMFDYEKAKQYYSQLKKSANEEKKVLGLVGLNRLSLIENAPIPADAHLYSFEDMGVEAQMIGVRRAVSLGLFQKVASDSASLLHLLREKQEFSAYFSAWKNCAARVESTFERLYREALFLAILSRHESDRKGEVQNDLLQELQRVFPNSPEAALAHGYLRKSPLSFETYERRLNESSAKSARAFRRARLKEKALRGYKQNSQGLRKKHCQALTGILLRNSWNYQARYERAKLCIREGHALARASQDLNAVLKINPRHWKARLELANMLLTNKSEQSDDKAKSHFDLLIKQLATQRAGDSSINDPYAEAYYGRGIATRPFSMADLTAALNFVPRETARGLKAAIRYYQARAMGYKALGIIGLHEKDLQSVDNCRLEMKKRATRHFHLAENAKKSRRYNEALTQYNLALEYDENHAFATFQRGLCYMKIGNFIPGILDMARATELDYKKGWVFYNKIYQLNDVVDLHRVMAELNKCVEAAPNKAHVRFLRGFFYVAMTEFKEYEQSEIDRGKRDLKRAIELNPKFVSAYVFLSHLFIKENRIKEAVAQLDWALEIAPKAWDAYFYKAIAAGNGVQNAASDSSRAALQMFGRELLGQAMKNHPDFVDRATKESALHNLFANKAAAKAFIESFRQDE